MTWNSETSAVQRWLESEEVKPQLLRLVVAWNGLELLGIDLADQLETLVRESVRSSSSSELPGTSASSLDKVDWNHLAEHYAFEIAGVDEAELTRRRLVAGGEP